MKNCQGVLVRSAGLLNLDLPIVAVMRAMRTRAMIGTESMISPILSMRTIVPPTGPGGLKIIDMDALWETELVLPVTVTV